MGLPEDLLEQARHLASKERTRPKQASLRRAVSAAYYGLFHLLTAEAARNWKWEAHRAALRRAFDHGRMKTACDGQRKELQGLIDGKSLSTDRLAVVRRLHLVAETFVQLQDRRHLADYDLADSWTRTKTAEAIKAVEAAFEAWRAIRDEPEAQDFLLALLVKRR
jgi:hypothetical protein